MAWTPHVAVNAFHCIGRIVAGVRLEFSKLYCASISMSDSPSSDEHASVMAGCLSKQCAQDKQACGALRAISATDGPVSSLLEAAAQNLSTTKRVSRPVCIEHFPCCNVCCRQHWVHSEIRTKLAWSPSGEVMGTDWATLRVCISMSPSPSPVVRRTSRDTFLMRHAEEPPGLPQVDQSHSHWWQWTDVMSGKMTILGMCGLFLINTLSKILTMFCEAQCCHVRSCKRSGTTARVHSVEYVSTFK